MFSLEKILNKVKSKVSKFEYKCYMVNLQKSGNIVYLEMFYRNKLKIPNKEIKEFMFRP